MNGIRALIKETLESSLAPFHHMRTQREGTSMNHEVNQTLNPARTLPLDSPGSRTVGTTFQVLEATQPMAFC